MNKILKILAVIALLVALTNSISLFNLVTFNKTNGAMCMDGSKYGVYLFQPDTVVQTNKLLIYFEEVWQGWCPMDSLNESIANCYKYVNQSNYLDYGSSDNWGGSFTVLSGILSGNSIYASWPKIYVKSCDGGSYFSDSSVNYKNKTLNFRGYKNIMEMINYLNKNNLIANREQVLLIGVGNGGLASLAWADVIKANTKGKVRLLIDGGVWQNQQNQKTKQPVFENRMKNVNKLFINGSSFPNTKCTTANKDNLQRCFYASELTKYIDSNTQILFLQSYYDSWQAQQILGLNCTEEFGSLSQCTADHRQAIQDYHKKISTSLQQLTALPNVGAFGIACVAHFFTNGKWDYTDYSVPMNSNNTAQFVTTKWMNTKSVTEKIVYLDTVEWPNNKVCAHDAKGLFRKITLKNLKSQ